VTQLLVDCNLGAAAVALSAVAVHGPIALHGRLATAARRGSFSASYH